MTENKDFKSEEAKIKDSMVVEGDISSLDALNHFLEVAERYKRFLREWLEDSKSEYAVKHVELANIMASIADKKLKIVDVDSRIADQLIEYAGARIASQQIECAEFDDNIAEIKSKHAATKVVMDEMKVMIKEAREDIRKLNEFNSKKQY